MNKKLVPTTLLVIIAISIVTTKTYAQIPEDKQKCIIDGCNVGKPSEIKVLDRHAFAWNLFYKMMTAAFIVGAVVQGVLVYVVFHFREKKR